MVSQVCRSQKIVCKINFAGNNIFNCRKRGSQALRRRTIRAASPSRFRDAAAGSGTETVLAGASGSRELLKSNNTAAALAERADITSNMEIEAIFLINSR